MADNKIPPRIPLAADLVRRTMTTVDSKNDLPARSFAAVALILVAIATYLRITYANFGFFSDGDQSAIAYGVELLVRGAKGRMYNYPEQVGFYETARWLFVAFGERLTDIRDICVAISVAASIGISTLVLFLFPDHLTRRVRLLASAFVLLSPVLWKLAQYGNTALPSAFFVTAAFVAASRAGALRTSLAFVLWLIAVAFRADAVLVAPAFAMWFAIREGGSVKHGLVSLGVAILLFIGLKMTIDALNYFPSAGESISKVIFNVFQRGRFLSHLYWGVGPLVLIFVAAGWPQLARTPLWKPLALWASAPIAFYFVWSTTPRYCMLLVVPAALVAALGFDSIWRGLGTARVWLRYPGRLVVTLIALAPLQFTLSDAMPGDLESWRTPALYQVGDGPHYYGALLNKSKIADPTKGLPVDTSARELASLAKEPTTAYTRWIVIVDYWDDINVCNFYLAADDTQVFEEGNNFVVKYGTRTIQYLLQSQALNALQENPVGQSTLDLLSNADRVFRPVRSETKILDPLVDRFARAIGVTVISQPQAPLTELKFRPYTKLAPTSRGASRPSSQPASRRSSKDVSGPASKPGNSKVTTPEGKVPPGGR